MPEVRFGSWILTILYGIIRLATIVLTFAWRVLVAVLVTLWGLLRALVKNRIIAAFLIVLFGVGLPLQLFQEEIMTGLDYAYECGIYATAEFAANAFPLPIFRVPWEVASVEYNNIALLLVDGVDSLFDNMRALVRIKKLTSVKAGLGTITLMLFDDELGDAADVLNEIAEAVLGYLGGLWDFVTYVAGQFVAIINTLFFKFDFFSGSCSLCAADPPPRCNLRKEIGPFVSTADCDACHDHVANLIGAIGAFLDAISGNFVAQLSDTTSFTRIFRAFGCVVRSTYMHPLQMIDASISLAPGPPPTCYTEDEIFDIEDKDAMISRWFLGGDPNIYDCANTDSQICCGKPSGCAFPTDDPPGTDLPVGIAPCLAELTMALTDNQYADWLEILLTFLAEIILIVVKTVERTAECANPPPSAAVYNNATIDECFDNFFTQLGTAGVDPGICWYDDADATPDAGLHQCTGMIFTCLNDDPQNKAPLLVPLLEPIDGGSSIIEFFLVDLPRYAIDFVVCPFVTLGECMECVSQVNTVCDFGEWVAQLGTVETCSPAWWDVLEWLYTILNWVQVNIVGPVANFAATVSQLNTLQAAFNNVGSCWRGCEVADFTYEIGGLHFIECFPGGDGGCDEPLFTRFKDRRRLRGRGAAESDEVSDAAALKHWQASLPGWGIRQDTYCGGVLYSSTPDLILDEKWSDVTVFMACYGMYQMRYGVEDACNVSHSTADGLFDVLGDISSVVKHCDAEGVAVMTHHRPRNSTEPLPEQPPYAFGNGTINFTFAGASFLSRFNFTHASLVPQFLRTVYARVSTTRLYGRTAEFYGAYNARYGSATQAELDDIYTAYANDVLSLYHRRKFRNETGGGGDGPAQMDELALAPGQFYSKATGAVRSYMTPVSMKATRADVYRAMERLHILEPAAVAAGNATGQPAPHANLDAATMARWNTINDALHIEYKPWFQMAAGVVRALRTRDGSKLAGMLSGSTKYVASRGAFVPAAKFRYESRTTAGDQARPTLLDALPQSRVLQLAVGDEQVRAVGAVNKARGGLAWSARKARAYAPFPVPRAADGESDWMEASSGTPMRERVWARLSLSRAKYVKRRAERVVAAEAGRFDANQILYDVTDWLFGLFGIGGAEGLVNGLVGNTIEFFEAFDLRNFTEASVEQKLIDYFNCAIPENIDGTSLHSPFCLGLFREDAFALFSAVTGTEGQFPPQLPWPQELVTRDCVTTYNGEGADDLFQFAFSNNCLLDAALSTTSTCGGNASCAGTVALQAAEAVANRSVIAYSFAQTGASCALTGATFRVPECADVLAIESDAGCVAAWAVAADQASLCSPGITPDLPDRNVLDVRFSGAMLVNGACAFNVTFSKGVAFAAGETTVALAAAGEDVCKNCSLRIPVSTCLTAGSPLRDPWHELRPLCDGCDYCEREYQSCADAGFGDFLDSLFYVTGTLPRVADDALFSGIAAKQIEDWMGPPAVILGFFGPAFVLTPLLFVGIPICLPVWALYINLSHIMTWTLFIFFGGVLPYPLLFLAVSIYAKARMPSAGELFIWALIITVSPGLTIATRVVLALIIFAMRVPKLKQFVKPVFAIVGILVAVWILTLVFTFPLLSDVFNINQALTDILVAFDDTIVLFFLDVRPLIARLSNYIYPTGTAVPELHTFCFWWNWGNLGLLGLVLIFAIWPALLLFRVVFTPILLALETVWLAFDMRRRILFIRARDATARVSQRSENNRTRFRAMRDMMRMRFQKLRDKAVRTIVAWNGGGAPPLSAEAAAGEAPRRQLALNLTPDPDESHQEFRERRADAIKSAMAADHASDDDDDDDDEAQGVADDDSNSVGPVETTRDAPRPRRRRMLTLRGDGAGRIDLDSIGN